MVDVLGLDSLRKRVAALTAALTVSAGGYSFLSNPQGFVLYLLLDAIVGFVQDGAQWFGIELLKLNQTLQHAVFSPFGAIGDMFVTVGDTILDLLRTLNGVLVSTAAVAGPVAPFVVILLWVAVFALLTLLVEYTLQVLKWLS